MAESRTLTLTDARRTHALGRELAGALQAAQPLGLVVYLEGELGAGKTTLARGWLEGLGYRGRVPSPTYTLVEPYDLVDYRVYHIDLYRIGNPRELDDLGLADQLESGTVFLIEWPAHGVGHIPAADLRVSLSLAPVGRVAFIDALTPAGGAVLSELPADF